MARMIQVSDGRVIPETEMTPEQVAYYDRQNAAELLKNNPPATPLGAAIDKATGFAGTGTDGRSGAPEPQPEEAGAEARQPKTDWVEEAYKCFIKDAGDIDPTDPVKAVEAYFQKNATDELKARCKAEGKDAKGCWRFIEAVARKALHGSSGHIDPAVVYAIAMHWFEDVPKDWDAASAKASASAKATADKTARQAKPKKAGAKARQPKKPAETPSEIKKEKAKAKAKASASAAKPLRRDKKRPKQSQGFFFEMLETPVEGGTEK